MVERTILSSNGSLMMVKVKLPGGFHGDVDQHSEEQLSYLEKGKIELEVGNQKKIIEQGGVFHIPSNEVHRVKVIEECIIIDIFTPIRKDLLK